MNSATENTMAGFIDCRNRHAARDPAALLHLSTEGAGREH